MQINKPFTLISLLSAPLVHAQWDLVDDMENGNNWVGAGLIAPDPDDDGNQVFAVENSGLRVENYLTLASPIPDGTTGTLFFRLRSTANNGLVDWVAGTSDVSIPTNWPDYEGYIRLAEAGAPGDIDIDVRNGGGFTEVGPAPADTWINVWLVLNNTTDTTDVYFNTSPVNATSAGTFSLTGSAFRNGTTDDLVTLLAINNDIGTTGYLDDIYLDLSGENLTHPLAGDTDNDGLNDLWETNFFGDLSRNGSGDFDNDNLSDFEEFEEGTNPTLEDTDGDTLNDDIELAGTANPFDNAPSNPLAADSDGDGFDDAVEGDASSDPNDALSIPARPGGFQLVENFEGDEMVVGATFNGINNWSAGDPSAISVFVEEGSTDQVGRLERLEIATTSNTVSKSIDDLGLQILEGTTGTLFMQVLASSGSVDTSFGLSDVATPTAFGDFEAQSVLFPGNFLRARDGEAFRDQANFADNTWMNVWIVADNASDQVKIYVESPDGQEGQIEITDDGGIDPFDFRNGTSDRLASILLISALGGEAGSSVLVDNIYVDPTSANLTRPVASKGGAQALSITSTLFNENGDLVITFSSGGDGYILTSSPDLNATFEEEGGAIYDGVDTFTIAAGNLSADRFFFRVEKP